jgi:salicylate synthetase
MEPMMLPRRELHLPFPAAPHVLVTVLVEEGFLHGDYFLYCGRNRARIAGNWRADVTVSEGRVELRQAGNVVRTEPAIAPLSQAGRLLASLAGPWTAYGYLAFDLAHYYAPYPWMREEPALRMCVPGLEIHLKGGSLIVSAEDPEPIAQRLARVDIRSDRPASAASLTFPEHDRDGYCQRVARLRDAIRSGELQKAILSRRCNAPGRANLLETFGATSKVSVAPRSFCFQLGSVGAVGFSPEILLRCDDRGNIATNPLAGTRPRGADPAEDARLQAELYNDAKEVKEHALSVVAAQAALGPVCRRKTLRITDFMDVRKLHSVQHLSSHVRGQLAMGHSVWEALEAVFPGVTVSGIPKAEALAWIGELEGEPRGVYGGAVGWVDHRSRLDLAIALRTLFQYGDTLQLAAGAGIIGESQPEREYAESAMKLNAMASQVVLASRADGS